MLRAPRLDTRSHGLGPLGVSRVTARGPSCRLPPSTFALFQLLIASKLVSRGSAAAVAAARGRTERAAAQEQTFRQQHAPQLERRQAWGGLGRARAMTKSWMRRNKTHYPILHDPFRSAPAVLLQIQEKEGLADQLGAREHRALHRQGHVRDKAASCEANEEVGKSHWS